MVDMPLTVNPDLLARGWRGITATERAGLIFKQNGRHRRIVVTFDSLSESSHARSLVSGESVVAQAEADHLHFTYTETGWYQTPEIGAVVATARDICAAYSEIVTYGHSMGAYAALLFSGALRATRVLAFAPQFSVDPAKVPFENRFDPYVKSLDFCHDRMLEMISPTAEKTIVVDPFEEYDARHFRLIAAAPNVQPLLLPFAGHFPAQFLREAGILSTVVQSVLTGHLDQGPVREKLRSARRQSSRYYIQSAMALARRGRFRNAMDRANSAYLLAPDSPAVLEAYFAILQCDGLWYGLAHTLLRLIKFEKPEWTHYEGAAALMLSELKKRQLHKLPPD